MPIDTELLTYIDGRLDRIEKKLDTAIANKEATHTRFDKDISYLKGQIKIFAIIFGSALTALFASHFGLI